MKLLKFAVAVPSSKEIVTSGKVLGKTLFVIHRNVKT